jgi:hypothetical protein
MARVLISGAVFLVGLFSAVSIIWSEIAECAAANRFWFYPVHLVLSTLVCIGLFTRVIMTVSVLQWMFVGLYVIAAVLALRNIFGGVRT